MSSFKAVYKRKRPALVWAEKSLSKHEKVSKLLLEYDMILNYMRFHLLRKHKDVQLKVGDWVFLKIQPFKQQSLRRHARTKLSVKFFAPFQIFNRVRAVAYRLELPLDAAIYPVFHVSQLKNAIITSPPPQVSLFKIDADMQ
ncbi:unnamed protein product [Spirodela intermedia]|uniref:Tf2-1-like SH3-like domain-containing protein n=1 Tax=Spirodela intermedia TaxID=51605 RepID=A0A7I8J6M0_SPIIN|nr:unnamed protein product [Spirodela intermedia]CAA6665887.1 unnamed protein product [Spirodela intermedia]